MQEVADSLDVSPRTVSRWIASGELIAHRFGRSVRIADDDLRAFLARRRGHSHVFACRLLSRYVNSL
jgi:excisionase family DNA binding protein